MGLYHEQTLASYRAGYVKCGLRKRPSRAQERLDRLFRAQGKMAEGDGNGVECPGARKSRHRERVKKMPSAPMLPGDYHAGNCRRPFGFRSKNRLAAR